MGTFNVANNIKHFNILNKKVAELLIENDEACCVKENLDKFEDLDQKVAELLIEQDYSDEVLKNINKFYIKDESRLALKIIDTDISSGAFTVAQALDKFIKLSQQVVVRLIENGEGYCVGGNLDKFEGLDQKLAEKLIENDEVDAVLNNVGKFSAIDESRLALKIIDSDSSLGAFTIMQSLDKFTKLSQQVVVRLIENDEAYGVLNNISKFSVTNESQVALKIMECDSDGTDLIIENFDKFKDLSKRVVSEIIKNESTVNRISTLSEELYSHLGSFTKDAQDFIKGTYRAEQ